VTIRPGVGQIWRVVDPKGTLARVGDQIQIDRVIPDPRTSEPVSIGYRYVAANRTGGAVISSFYATFAPVQD
jgi:hypothetical protein